MKLPALLFAITFANAMVAMDDQTSLRLSGSSGSASFDGQGSTAENPVSTLRGTVKRNQEGGRLECEVTYNRTTGTYSGTEYNRGYSIYG